MGNIHQLAANASPSKPTTAPAGILVGIVDRSTPASYLPPGVTRQRCDTEFDALISDAGSAQAVSPEFQAGSNIVAVAPAIAFDDLGNLTELLSRLSQQAGEKLEKTRDCVEFRIVVSDMSGTGATASRGSGRVAMRIAAALADLSRAMVATAEPLRVTTSSDTVLAISVLVHRGLCGRFLAKAKSLAVYSRSTGLQFQLSGPLAPASFPLEHSIRRETGCGVRRMA